MLPWDASLSAQRACRVTAPSANNQHVVIHPDGLRNAPPLHDLRPAATAGIFRHRRGPDLAGVVEGGRPSARLYYRTPAREFERSTDTAGSCRPRRTGISRHRIGDRLRSGGAAATDALGRSGM